MSLDPEGIDLKKIANNKKFKYFIETGTGYGGAVEGAIKSEVFDKIISIELNPELVEYCRDKFKDNTNVEIVTGSSDVELPKILEEIDGNFILMLDAHNSGGPHIGESMLTYLPKEMEELVKFKSKMENSILLIDDMGWFIPKNHNGGDFSDFFHVQGPGNTNEPFLLLVENLVKKIKPNSNVEYYRSTHPPYPGFEAYGSPTSLILVCK
jgi:hypothetical protein